MFKESHGMSKTPFYNVWHSMKLRCKTPSTTSYKHYGARGIKVCERWEKFENFRDDMYASYLDHLERYGRINTTLDRKDTNGNYEPDNCRWATCSEQNYSRRHNYPFIYTGVSPEGLTVEFENVRKFSRENGFNAPNIQACISGLQKKHRGWKFSKKPKEQALNE